MQDGTAKRRFSAARFPYNAQCLSLFNLEGDAVHSVKLALSTDSEIFLQILHFQNGTHVVSSFRARTQRTVCPGETSVIPGTAFRHSSEA